MRRNHPNAGCLKLIMMIGLVSCMVNVETRAQDPLQMVVGDVSGYPGQLVEIPVTIQTDQDSLDGFQISLSLSGMELMYLEVDTIVQGSDTSFVCDFDTTGTLTAGWGWMGARSTVGRGLDIRLSGFSSISAPHIPGIADYTSGTLIRFYGRIRDDVPDTLTNRTVDLIVSEASTYYSNEIGALIDPVENLDGSVTVGICDCGVWGDVNGDGHINPVDVVFMINEVYLLNDMRVQPPACPREAGDVNCDGTVNPVDVVLYINQVYLSTETFCGDPCD